MHSLLPHAKWHYCPTSGNPADLLSRGTTTEALISLSVWNYGPKWLTTPSQWPSSQLAPLPPLVLAMEVATEFVPAVQPPPDYAVLFLSTNIALSTNCCLSVHACVIRFLGNLKVQLQHKQFGPINAEELHNVSG